MRAKVTKIVFGGIVVVPIAWRKNENTTTSRKNEVITKIIVGARASMVKTMTILSTVTSCFGVFGALRLKFTVGIVASGAANITPQSKKSKKSLFTHSP